jgi:hypothetical protein
MVYTHLTAIRIFFTVTAATVLFLTTFTVSNAQEEIATTSVPTATEEAATTTATTTEPVVTPEATPEEISTSALGPRAQQRITNLAANISNRFDAVIARLQNISGRLETRLQKLQAEGQSNESAQASLVVAQEALSTAKANMASIDEQVQRTVGSTEPLREWRIVRQNYSETKTIILTAHTELRNTIALIKNPTATENTATTTEETITN